eukprot:Pompholyxophrys_punicea_v1_NODE_312_length_2298_cov_5.277307.p2 type:complete len:166 gc:universal NODE_312_length_2298_cov_5.277307:1437-940(-)
MPSCIQLRKFNVLYLPSEDTLKAYIRNYRHGVGLDTGYRQVMEAYIEKFKNLTSGIPQKDIVRDGWVIFDETKITAGIVWNCVTEEIVGFAMNASDLVELTDLFSDQTSSTETPLTDHILMFLFRSSIYDFQIIGPHYSSKNGMNGSTLAVCLTEFVRYLYSAGF